MAVISISTVTGISFIKGVKTAKRRLDSSTVIGRVVIFITLRFVSAKGKGTTGVVCSVTISPVNNLSEVLV